MFFFFNILYLNQHKCCEYEFYCGKVSRVLAFAICWSYWNFIFVVLERVSFRLWNDSTLSSAKCIVCWCTWEKCRLSSLWDVTWRRLLVWGTASMFPRGYNCKERSVVHWSLIRDPATDDKSSGFLNTNFWKWVTVWLPAISWWFVYGAER